MPSLLKQQVFSALAMHGRTPWTNVYRSRRPRDPSQGRSSFDQDSIHRHGDIRTVQEAKQRIEEVGADAVMMAALPWEIPTSLTKSTITLKQEKSYLI